MTEIIRPGDAVALPTETMVGRVVLLYGKGTKADPVLAVVEIPAHTRTIDLAKLRTMEPTDG